MKNKFLEIVKASAENAVLKKLVFSRPYDSEIQKVSARLVSHRSSSYLSFEYSLPGNTVSQKNLPIKEIDGEILTLLGSYKQANLITTVTDAEYKAKDGREIILGYDKLMKKLNGDRTDFESAIESLDNKKNYVLSGNEEFLKALEISDKLGRVHDKKQGKFRQINRFLLHIESILENLPEKKITVYDLCSGKSYLSFAVYYYLTEIKKIEVSMLAVDLKRDVIAWCEKLALNLGFSGMRFLYKDIRELGGEGTPDLVLSLHACDIATDIVIDSAIALGAKVILSTPCCHRYLNDKISNEALNFTLNYPHLKNKLCEAFTDAIRIKRLEAAGYEAAAIELTDPDATPKNTLIKAIKLQNLKPCDIEKRKEELEKTLSFVLGKNKEDYLKEIKK